MKRLKMIEQTNYTFYFSSVGYRITYCKTIFLDVHRHGTDRMCRYNSNENNEKKKNTHNQHIPSIISNGIILSTESLVLSVRFIKSNVSLMLFAIKFIGTNMVPLKKKK